MTIYSTSWLQQPFHMTPKAGNRRWRPLESMKLKTCNYHWIRYRFQNKFLRKKSLRLSWFHFRMIQVDSSSPRKSLRGISITNFLTVFEERSPTQHRKATYCFLHQSLPNIKIPPLPHLLLLLIALLFSRQDSDCFAHEKLMLDRHPRY